MGRDESIEQLETLGRRFIGSGPRRLDEVERLLALFPDDRSGADTIHRHLHALASLGATYGFPAASQLALEGESLLEGLLAGTSTADEAATARLLTLVREVRASLTTAPAPIDADLLAMPPRLRDRVPHALVVADDPDLNEDLMRMLDGLGWSSSNARTVADAVTEIACRTPEALLTDIRLGDGTGYEIIEALRAHPGGERSAAVVTSGASGFLDKVEAMRCGADAYFEKPIDDAALARRLQQMLTPANEQAGRILLVEPDEDQSAYLEVVLQSAGYQTSVCSDPGHFEDHLGEFVPDLVVMNVHLPVVSGYDLGRWMRQSEKWMTVPIVFLTTDTPLSSRIESMRAGADDHLVEPVPPPLLLSTVEARTGRSRLLRNLVERDGLTGLLTHSAFMQRLKSRYAQSRRSSLMSSALAMIDLDHFKVINDRYGHPTGDRVLIAVASLLRRRLRQSDTIGRYGGEEFAILIEDLNREEALRLIERLLEEFRQITIDNAEGESFSVTFSGGIAMLESQTSSFEEWVDQADRSLYRAKNGGRDRIEIAP